MLTEHLYNKPPQEQHALLEEEAKNNRVLNASHKHEDTITEHVLQYIQSHLGNEALPKGKQELLEAILPLPTIPKQHRKYLRIQNERCEPTWFANITLNTDYIQTLNDINETLQEANKLDKTITNLPYNLFSSTN
ncbi:MAG: hypothetical protein ACMXYD_04365 [Candidatus Woesearchaeota archaeon]